MPRLFVFSNVNLYDNETADNVLGNIEKNLIKIQNNFTDKPITLLASTLWELHSTSSLENTLNFIKDLSYRRSIEYKLLYNTAVDQDDRLWKNKHCITYMFFLNKLRHSKFYHKQKFNEIWQNKEFRLLFLTGKLHKPNRIQPLMKLANIGLLENNKCVYSLHYNKNLVEPIAKAAEDRYNTVDRFLKKYQNTPDSALFLNLDSNTHYDGIPFDSKLYSRTSFSLISETEIGLGSVWITEKTWRAILNKHPFIIIGQPYTLSYLENLGLKTFREYFPYQYDNLEDLSERIDAVIKNISWLEKNWKSLDFKSIKKDIECNYQLAHRLSNKDLVAFLKKVNYNYGDFKVHAGLYDKGLDNPHILEFSRDHLCYYNWANYSNNYFFGGTRERDLGNTY